MMLRSSDNSMLVPLSPVERGDRRPPVVVLLGTTSDALATYRRRLPLDVTSVAMTSPELAEVVVRLADCAVVADGSARSARDVESHAVRLRRGNPDLAIVCATKRPARLARLQGAGLVDELLAFDAPVVKLRMAIEGARTGALLRQTAHALAQTDHFRPDLRDVLVDVLVGMPELHSVQEACARRDVSQRILRHQWRSTTQSDSLRLRDVMTWTLALRASILRTRGSSWHNAAARLNVHQEAIARAARHGGGTLPPDPWVDLASGVHSALRCGFRHNVVRHLLGRQHAARW